MQNLLIINLDGPESILFTGTLINSIKSYLPDARICYLGLQEEINYFKALPFFEEFFPIEKKKIKTYLKGKIYPDALAINSLEKTISNVCKNSWDAIIHTGNSFEGATISSLINLKTLNANFYGKKLESTNTIFPSNHWFLCQESLKYYKFNPLANLEYLHLGNNLFFDPQIPKKVHGHKKIGIQLPINPDDTFLPFQTIVEVIELLRSSEDYSPLLLVDFNHINKDYFSKLNRYFNYELDIAYLDFENTKKILIFLDCLISGKSQIKFIAHYEGVPLIEITDQLENALIGPKSLIIKKGLERIKGEDIYNLLKGNFFLNPVDFQLFSCTQDRIGYRLARLNGPFQIQEEITRLMARYLIGAIYLQERDETILSDIGDFPQKEALDWINKEKRLVEEISGKILNTLRLLSLIGENLSYKRDFVSSLDEVLSFSNMDNLISLPILIFKYQIENSNTEEIKVFENFIFNLKELTQIVLSSIRDLENQIWNRKKVNLIKKAFGNKEGPIEELPQ